MVFNPKNSSRTGLLIILYIYIKFVLFYWLRKRRQRGAKGIWSQYNVLYNVYDVRGETTIYNDVKYVINCIGVTQTRLKVLRNHTCHRNIGFYTGIRNTGIIAHGQRSWEEGGHEQSSVRINFI